MAVRDDVPASELGAGPDPGLVADSCGCADLLGAQEAAAVVALPDHLEREGRPIADDHWERAEFPTSVIRPLGALGAHGPHWEESRTFASSAVHRGRLRLTEPLGLGRLARAAHRGDPLGRHLGARWREALDQQRHLRRRGRGPGP